MKYEETFQLNGKNTVLIKIKEEKQVVTWLDEATGIRHYTIKGRHILLTYQELIDLHLVKGEKKAVKKLTFFQRLKKMCK